MNFRALEHLMSQVNLHRWRKRKAKFRTPAVPSEAKKNGRAINNEVEKKLLWASIALEHKMFFPCINYPGQFSLLLLIFKVCSLSKKFKLKLHERKLEKYFAFVCLPFGVDG